MQQNAPVATSTESSSSVSGVNTNISEPSISSSGRHPVSSSSNAVNEEIGESEENQSSHASRKRSGLEAPISTEPSSFTSKKKAKLSENSDSTRHRDFLTTPPRRVSLPRHLGISPVKLTLSLSDHNREVFWDQSDNSLATENISESEQVADTLRLSSMWQKLHEGGDSTTDPSHMSDSHQSHKSGISLSKLLQLKHQRSTQPAPNGAPSASSQSTSMPLHEQQTSASSSSLPEDVKTLLQKLSSLSKSSAAHDASESNNDDSFCENDSCEEGDSQPSEDRMESQIFLEPASSVPSARIAPTPKQIETTPKSNTLPPPIAYPKASITQTAPKTNTISATAKRSIFGNRLSSSNTSSKVLVSTNTAESTPKPLISRSMTSDSNLRLPPPPIGSSQLSAASPSKITRHLSESSLSQASQAAPKSAVDVLDWIQESGLSYEDLFSDEMVVEATTTTNASDSNQGFLKEGEKVDENEVRTFADSSSPSSSRPVTPSIEQVPEEALETLSHLAASAEALENEDILGEIEKMVSARSMNDCEEEEETALTTSRYRRFLILEVGPGVYGETRLRALDETNNSEHFIALRDEWKEMDVRIGDCMNIVGRIEPKGSAYTYVVDSERNLAILFPDVLVTGTVLAQTSDCPRRAVINYSIKQQPRLDMPTAAPSEENGAENSNRNSEEMGAQRQNVHSKKVNDSDYSSLNKRAAGDPRLALYGIFVHELFQTAIDNLDFTVASLTAHSERLILERLVDIFAIGDSEECVQKALLGWIPSIASWAEKYFPTATTDIKNATNGSISSKFKGNKESPPNAVEVGGKKYLIQVLSSLDVEEHIVSIMYGLKGDIDVTLIVQITAMDQKLENENQNSKISVPSNHNGSSTMHQDTLSKSIGNEGKSIIVPLEIKSGNLNSSFGSQVILYSLLLADRYHRDIPTALLFSIKENIMAPLEITRKQVLYAIMNRNAVASNLARPHVLPPLLHKRYTCTNCYQVNTCMVLHKAFEHGNASTSGIDDIFFDEMTSNVTEPSHARFVSHWFNLIDLEAGEILTYRNQTWGMPQKDREKVGRCLGGLRLLATSTQRYETSNQLNSSIRSSQPPTQSQRLGTQESRKSIATGKRLLYLTFERWPTQISEYEYNTSTPASSILRSQPHRGVGGSLNESIEKTQTLDFSQSTRRVPMSDLQFNPGDHVVLSEGRHFGIANCSVVEVTNNSITIVCNRSTVRAPPRETSVILPTSQRFTPLQSKLSRRDNAKEGKKVDRNENFENFEIPDIEEIGATGMPSQQIDAAMQEFNERNPRQVRWRLDRDEAQANFHSLKGNVLQLFQATSWAKKFRPLFVDYQKPRFEHTPISSSELEMLKTNGVSLNDDQLASIQKVMDSRDYALILGMPGTGKTTTVAALVKLLVSRGKSVLLSAGTHSAVDGLLVQCLRLGIPFLRLGQPDLVHPSVRPHTLIFESQRVKSVSELNDLLGPQSPRSLVVGATCLGTNHLLLQSRFFDYCIVDETSQITFPAILGPARLASQCVFIGDLYQLPPIVKNAQASEAGLGNETIFKILAERHPSSICKLKTQYRMNSDIMSLSNQLIYQGQLKCGNETIAKRKLQFSDQQISMLDSFMDKRIVESLGYSKTEDANWLAKVMSQDRSVVFLNTDSVPAPEEKLEMKDIVRNPVEAILVAQLVESLLILGVDRGQIGVISPLRAQLKQIHSAMASIRTMTNSNASNSVPIDVHTVDKYQGADIDCVIVSFVRSNEFRAVGTLLKDWRRINVAFTRAKRKLIIIGSRSTLSSNHLLAAFFEMVDKYDFSVPLPRDAHKLFFSAATRSLD